MKRRYIALQEFVLAYFHEDWRLDANSRADVVADFLRSESVSRVTAVLDDLRELLAEPATEGELHDALIHEYSLSYDPWVDKTTTREWLEGLQREMQNSPEGA
jgi:hypothetical protein